MKKIGGKIAVVLAVIALLGVYYYVALPAVNIHLAYVLLECRPFLSFIMK